MATSDVDPIDCSVQPLDISFHPKHEHLVAAALVDGTLEVHDFSPSNSKDDEDDDSENDTIVSSIPLHTQLIPSKSNNGGGGSQKPRQASCRSVLFSHDGSRIYTGGSGGDLCEMDAQVACTFGSAKRQKPTWRESSKGGIQSMFQLLPSSPTGPLLVTGSEEGMVRLWDTRVCGAITNETRNKREKSRACVMSWEDKQFDDYISSFAQHEQQVETLLCSSADGTLGVIDLRKATGSSEEKRQSLRQSDNQEDELLSVQVLKNGKKVVCGTQEGVLAVWSWGVWGDVSDRFPGHPASIDALLKVDEDTLLTGCSDGLLRLVQIHPDKLLGVLGDHEGFPIEKLRFNATKSHVGSVSHDNLIHLWDASVLQENDDDDSDEEEPENEKQSPVQTTAATAKASTEHDSDDEWEDMDDDDEGVNASSVDDSDDSGEDEKKVTTNDRRAKKFKSDREKFFEDL